MDVTTRAIAGHEWPLWRALRLRALEDSPDSFTTTLAEEAAHSGEWWSDLIGATASHERGLLLVAEVGGESVGMLFGRVDADFEVLDIASMWVAADSRRLGVAMELIVAAVQWARDAGAGRAELWVTAGNGAAEQLYRKAGFSATGETEILREGSERQVVRLSTRI